MSMIRRCITCGAFLFLMLCAWARPGAAAPTPSPGAAAFQEMEETIMTVSNTVKMSVVHIEVVARRGDRQLRALGSGLVVDATGVIVTNAHVVDNVQEITVLLPDDTTKYPAEVVNSDQQTDLAVIRIKPTKPLAAATLGNSDAVQVGEWVLAIGNPYGFDRTVSFGIISGKGRILPDRGSEVQLLNDFLQTDALIDPGSSGGPLVNLRGEVLGINSVGVGRGQGFTIPSNVVKDVLKKSLSAGGIERGWLGVYTQAFPQELAAYFGLPGRQGILVSDVEPGSPAAIAGLRTGDILTTVNGSPVAADSQSISTTRPSAALIILESRKSPCNKAAGPTIHSASACLTHESSARIATTRRSTSGSAGCPVSSRHLR